jgi:hypothetical protein
MSHVEEIRAAKGWRQVFKRWVHAFRLWKHWNGRETRYFAFRECLNMADFIDIFDE